MKRRNKPGTSTGELYQWEALPKFSEIESIFASQEYLQYNLRKFQALSNKEKKNALEQLIPVPQEIENSNEEVSENDKNSWIFENFRQFLLELNHFVIAHDTVCNKETQPEMKITAEDQKKMGVVTSSEDSQQEQEDLVFLCAAFEPPKSVPAIDYMIHTIAQATQICHDQKLFPNRIAPSTKGIKEIKTQLRRLYRIFAFSFFIHNEKFVEYEKRTHLCERFTKFCKKYKLMSKDLFLIPEKVFKKMY